MLLQAEKYFPKKVVTFENSVMFSGFATRPIRIIHYGNDAYVITIPQLTTLYNKLDIESEMVVISLFS